VADIDKAKAESVVGEIVRAGGTAVAIAADAGRPAGIDAMIGGAVQAFGGLDILHNNAFGQPALPGPLRELLTPPPCITCGLTPPVQWPGGPLLWLDEEIADLDKQIANQDLTGTIARAVAALAEPVPG
jgi:NAD(P)-dependent dehydrogenase (short-subunit alcohol dehydrogenase family)